MYDYITLYASYPEANYFVSFYKMFKNIVSAL